MSNFALTFIVELKAGHRAVFSPKKKKPPPKKKFGKC